MAQVEDADEKDAIRKIFLELDGGFFEEAQSTLSRTFPSPTFYFSDRALLHKFFDCISAIDHSYLRDDIKNLSDVVADVIRRDPDLAKSTNANGDGKLPLHRAIYFAHSCQCCKFELPLDLLKALVEAYPDAVRKTDGLGDLPLHIAARLRGGEIISYFLDMYPSGASQTNRNGTLPIQEFMYNSSPWLAGTTTDITRELLDKLHQAAPESIDARDSLGNTLLGLANDSARAEWVIEKNPALCCVADGQGNLPLYASIPKPSVSCDMLRRMAEAYPEALLQKNPHGWTPFHRLFQCPNRKDQEEVFCMFSSIRPAGPSVPDKLGKTAMHLAVGGYKQLDLELIHQAFPDGLSAIDNDGNSPLHLIKNEKNAEWCVGKNPDLCRVANDLGELPLHIAAKVPLSVDALRKFIDAYPGALEKPTKAGELPLHYVVKAPAHSGIAAFREIMNRHREGARVADESGALPIHHFMRSTGFSTQLLDDLIECAPEALRAADENGNTILHLADNPVKVSWAVEKCPELCGVPNKDGDLPLHTLRNIYSGGRSYRAGVECSPRIGAVLSMIDAYPDALKSTNNRGQLPIHKATCCRSEPILRRFIDGYPEGASRADDDGRFPIHRWMEDRGPACVVYQTSCLQMLYDSYPEGLAAVDGEGNTPLHLAADGYRIAWALRTRPETCQVQNSKGEFPLHLVDFRMLSTKLLGQMIDQEPGSLTKADTEKGNTPLHNAIMHGARSEIVRWLLNKNSAAASRSNRDGRLPLHLFCRRKPSDNDDQRRRVFGEVLNAIVEAHPDGLAVADHDGHIPAHYARVSGHCDDIVKSLEPLSCSDASANNDT